MKHIKGKNIKDNSDNSNKKEHNSGNLYQKEYNITHIAVGILSICVFLAPIMSGFMVFQYLSEINSKDLFFDSLSQNPIGIIIPMTIYILSPFLPILATMMRYESSLEKVNFDEKSKTHLRNLHIIENFLFFYSTYITFLLINEDIGQITITGYIIISLEIILITMVMYFIIKEIENINKLFYIPFTLFIYTLMFVFTIFFLGRIELINIKDFYYSLSIFITLNTIYALLYIYEKGARKKNCLYIIICAFVLSYFYLSQIIVKSNEQIYSSIISLGMADKKDSIYFIEIKFIENNIESITKQFNIEVNGYLAYCGKVYWKTNQTIVFKRNIKDDTYIQIPKDKIYKYQGNTYNCSNINDEKNTSTFNSNS